MPDRQFGPTCGGPRIVPFQLDIIRSLPSAKPYEQASRGESVVSFLTLSLIPAHYLPTIMELTCAEALLSLLQLL